MNDSIEEAVRKMPVEGVSISISVTIPASSTIEEALQKLAHHDELAVEVARKLGVTTFVRGLRNSQDLDYEGNLNFFNHELAPEIETIFLISKPAYQHLSSSRIRELISFEQDISKYVPESVIKELKKKYGKTKQ